MYKQAWEGHLRQYTLAKTVKVPLALDGMYYKEFPVTFDWLHNGEGITVFNLQGLNDPLDARFDGLIRLDVELAHERRRFHRRLARHPRPLDFHGPGQNRGQGERSEETGVARCDVCHLAVTLEQSGRCDGTDR
jgi:hypothetical protein